MTKCFVQQNGCFVASAIPVTYQVFLRNWQQRPTYVFSVISLMEKAAVTGVQNLK